MNWFKVLAPSSSFTTLLALFVLLKSRSVVADPSTTKTVKLDNLPLQTSAENLDDLLAVAASQASRVSGEDIVIVGNGTVNIDPREFLLRQFPHLAKKLFGAAFGGGGSSGNNDSNNLTGSSTTEGPSTTTTVNTPSSFTSPVPSSTTVKSVTEYKLSQRIKNDDSLDNNKAAEPAGDAASSGSMRKYSMIIAGLSDVNKMTPRPSRISLKPFGSAFLPEFSSSEEPKDPLKK
jgi:hypothetical protein